MFFIPPNVMVDWVALLLLIRENLYLETRCPDWGHPGFPQSLEAIGPRSLPFTFILIHYASLFLSFDVFSMHIELYRIGN
jgi:hypothetical protein